MVVGRCSTSIQTYIVDVGEGSVNEWSRSDIRVNSEGPVESLSERMESYESGKLTHGRLPAEGLGFCTRSGGRRLKRIRDQGARFRHSSAHEIWPTCS